MESIIEINNKDRVYVDIYIIRNKLNNKVYVGQTVTHKLNKSKYRYFGYKGRFNDHVSEAINNTKQKQCTYLNNSIRKYGKENFDVNIIETCETKNANLNEIYYINKYNSIYPFGYNLTKGGKHFIDKRILNDNNRNLLTLNTIKKRGRDFGYVHKEETYLKMKLYHKQKHEDINFISNLKNRMSNTIKTYFNNKKIEILSKYSLNLPLEQYIKPVCLKNTDIHYNYLIKINNNKYKLKNKNTLEEKYNTLLNILKISYQNSKNCKDHPKG